jgi:hypothetical protein
MEVQHLKKQALREMEKTGWEAGLFFVLLPIHFLLKKIFNVSPSEYLRRSRKSDLFS